MSLPYWIVDAFTNTLFTGNPAAVVLPQSPLPEAMMQQIAAENNLSETAFAVPEADGWRLRWFTPTVEVDLCGHATLATAFVLGSLGHKGPLTFHTKSGPLTARLDGALIELDFPAYASTQIAPPAGLAEAIGVIPQEVRQAAQLIAVLESAEQVASLQPDIDAIARLPKGVLMVTAAGGITLEGQGADITSRLFAPGFGIPEDPVTGALHTQVVPYWAEKLQKPQLLCHQASPRGGWLTCTYAPPRVRMAGTAQLYATGQIQVS